MAFWLLTHSMAWPSGAERATASAAVAPCLQFNGCQVGNEVRFPLMAARLDRAELAFAGEVTRLFGPLTEIEIIVENEPLAVKQVKKNREIGDGCDTRRLRS